MQGDFITKQTAVAPANTPDCPRWIRFLDDATRGDALLVRYLRRLCGYCLTRDIREHALVFIFGPGGNGSQSSQHGQPHSRRLRHHRRDGHLRRSEGERHPADLAMLRGARLVSVPETEEGHAWAENRIKTLTGGDPISARFMRQDFFAYRPQFKITIIGNHKPVLRNVDDAVCRRFNLAPFVHKQTVPDKELKEKLQAEHPAILRWMIEGCVDWQMHGLIQPANSIRGREFSGIRVRLWREASDADNSKNTDGAACARWTICPRLLPPLPERISGHERGFAYEPTAPPCLRRSSCVT